ncbi:hypothetical protein VSH64_20830 [Amycolatopsis rhabdoformis]|uniref:Uncharacterized protein n=1 Tax=Amycolatopsis rhabdoformis TaxID=1448059 RepID=A0ABZ1IJU0_9PSEU|nr:hypothetical protein [Amycolatopsis rhabdoformis]WSE34498.1 hypothetical protein VSH64_20830 [Amycolatopsis rhabdoformis]
MRPTVDDQLHGAQRLLDAVAADPELSRDSREHLANVRRLLTQVGRSWSALLPFHTADNLTMAELLTRWAPAGTALAEEISQATQPVETGFDPTRAAERNAELRALLSRVIADLPRTGAGHREITEYLVRRVETDPS